MNTEKKEPERNSEREPEGKSERKPTVSVILPVYNGECFLQETLDSVQRQTYRELQILAVDDGSTDGTGQILARAAAKDPRIRVITTENRGVSLARNRALEEAEGEYVYFLDADDLLEPGAVQAYVAAAQKEQADMVLSPYTEFFEDGLRRIRCLSDEYAEAIERYRDQPLRLLFYTDFITWNIWGRLYRRELLSGLTFAPELRIAEDLLFLTQVLERCGHFAVLTKPQYRYRIHGASVMGRAFSEKNLDILTVVERIRQQFAATEYEKDAESFSLKYQVWFYGYFLRNCPRDQRGQYQEAMAEVRERIRQVSCSQAYRLLSKKKWIEYLSLRISPAFYEAWIGLAYGIRDRIWNQTKRG